MTKIQRGSIIMVNLDPTKGSETGKVRPCIVVTNDTYNQRVPVLQVTPITEWTERKEKIITNVTLEPDKENKLTKKSVADCLQTRPIDRRRRLLSIKGKVSKQKLSEIDEAIKVVFGLK